MIKERPILFSGPMVRAILDGRKSETRRVVNRLRKFGSISGPLTEFGKSDTQGYDWHFRDKGMRWHDIDEARLLDLCPHGKIGDRLWVRETFCVVDDTQLEGDKWIDYRATPRYSEYHPAGWDNDPENTEALKWKPSIHMPRWASRILLEITNVRVERLNSITEKDCYDEGIEELDGHFDESEYCSITKKIGACIGDSKPVFVQLWESINGQGSWDLNPWVWVVEFKRIG